MLSNLLTMLLHACRTVRYVARYADVRTIMCRKDPVSMHAP